MLTGTDSAPAKANEAAQKNDIGTAKDKVYLDAQNAQTEAYTNVYVEPGTAKGSASTTVGQQVIDKILAKYGTVKTVGKASIQAEQENAQSNGKIRIWTTDFKVEGTIYLDGGALSWEDIDANTLQLDSNPTRTIALTSEQNFGALKNSSAFNLPSDKNTIVTKQIEVTTGTETTTQTQQIVIPAGFIVPSSSADTLEGGMVIKNSTDGNEFVWVPVNQPVRFHNNAGGGIGTITLARYTFGTSSSPVISAPIAESTQITLDSDVSYNTTEENIARSISDFKSNSNNAKGYYIGRYEMGIEGATVDTDTKVWSETSTGSKKVVCQSEKTVYNYISITDAISESQGLYDGIKKGDTEIYTSDLVNSLAWDTALVYIIKCGGVSDYAFQNGYHTGGPFETGSESDNPCNINDMAKNAKEFTTETNNSSYPCVSRGGKYDDGDYYTSIRTNGSGTPGIVSGFRPIIYISSSGS